jgi:hypothetical protein
VQRIPYPQSDIAALAALLPPPDVQPRAAALLGLMEGALAMARAVAQTDPAQSDAILHSAAQMALGQG